MNLTTLYNLLFGLVTDNIFDEVLLISNWFVEIITIIGQTIRNRRKTASLLWDNINAYLITETGLTIMSKRQTDISICKWKCTLCLDIHFLFEKSKI